MTAYWRTLLRPRTGTLLAIGAASTAESLLQVANVGLLIPLVAVVLNDRASTGGALDTPILGAVMQWAGGMPRPRAMLLLGVLMVTVVLAKGVFTVLRGYLAARLLNRVRFDLTGRLFERYVRARYLDCTEQRRGETLYNVWDPPIQVAEVVRAGAEALSTVLQIVGLCWLAATISWPLALGAGASAGLSVLIYHVWFRPRLFAVTERTYALGAQAHAAVAEAIEGVRQIKAFAAERRVIAAVRDIFTRIDVELGVDSRLRFLPVPLNDILSITVVLALVSVAMFYPPLQLPSAYIVGFILALARVAPLFYTLLNQKIALDAARHNIAVTADLLAKLPIESFDHGVAPPRRIDTLTLRNVRFVYPSRPEVTVLQDVSLEFRRGMVTALVGVSGAGKSTLADVLIRLIHPTSGEVLADGVDISRYDLELWRRSIGFVSQDPFLFNVSVRENIGLGDPGVTFDAIVNAARRARIHDVIATLPNGYDTVVGDRGVKLSGGQRQRVAIARALLTEPPILIFDEATSALDNQSERLIRETISEMRGDRITVVIAHRLSTIETADRVVVLDHGTVAEEGTPLELAGRGGMYATLYARMPYEAASP